MRHFVESLENRRLMSVRPDGVVTGSVPLDTAPVLDKGVLAVDGTAGDDNISAVLIHSKTAGLQLVVRVVSGRTVAGKLNGDVTRFVSVPATSVEQVVVTGNGGTDQLVTDVTSYKITKSVDVDTRLVSGVNKKGRTVYDDDAMSTAMIGVYGGSTASWKKRSYGDILRSHKAAYQSDVLFLGNSHVNHLLTTGATVFEEKLGTVPNLNLGLPGDTTSQLLYRVQQQNMLFGVQAKVIVLEIGSNNVALSDDVDAITRGVEAVVTEVHARVPNAKILLNSILPRRTTAENRVINKVNDRLRTYCIAPVSDKRNAPHRAVFLDMTADFTGERTLERYYLPNNIHLNSRGYRVWVDALATYINGVLNNG